MQKLLIFLIFFFLSCPIVFGNFFHGLKEIIDKNAQAQREIEIKRQQRGEEKVVNNSYATNWLDSFHDSIFITVQGQITRADTLFVKKKQSAIDTPHSNFELAIYSEITHGSSNGMDFAFEPEFDIDLAIPNLEKSLKLYVNTTPIGSLPGVDPVEEDNQLHIGIQSVLEHPEPWLPKLNTSIGIDWNWPPDPYVEVNIKKSMNFGSLRLYPSQTFWINTQDRLSEKSTLRTDYWLSTKMLTTIWSSIKYTKEDSFFSWEQSQSIIYCLNSYGLDMNTEKMHYCKLKFSMFGDNTVMKEYRLTTAYKFPIYKDWIFIEIIPELKFQKEEDWEPVRVLRVGISALFWGVYNLQK